MSEPTLRDFRRMTAALEDLGVVDPPDHYTYMDMTRWLVTKILDEKDRRSQDD